jgi:predicted dehydrogenase
MMARVGYLIVGAGAISAQHIEAIRITDGAYVAGVCDASPERAQAAGERWGVPWSADLGEGLAWSDVDAAAICTPSGLHAEQALAALRSGKHVLIEKPIALSLGDADRIVMEARSRDLLVSTVSQRRFEPAVQTIRQVLSDGALGPLAFVEGLTLDYRPQQYYDSAAWRGTHAFDGGALMNQGIHMVDLVRWLAGPIVLVAGQAATVAKKMEAEDTATAAVVFASGALGSLVATTCAYPGVPHELRIHGERGYIHLRGEDLADWEVPGVPRPEPAQESAGPAAATWGTTFVGHARQYRDVTSAIAAHTPPAISGVDGRETLAVVLAVYESATTGHAVKLRDVKEPA